MIFVFFSKLCWVQRSEYFFISYFFNFSFLLSITQSYRNTIGKIQKYFWYYVCNTQNERCMYLYIYIAIYRSCKIWTSTLRQRRTAKVKSQVLMLKIQSCYKLWTAKERVVFLLLLLLLPSFGIASTYIPTFSFYYFCWVLPHLKILLSSIFFRFSNLVLKIYR